uniref:Uncharacterized protein n=1 Tax=Megaviridae environmental sample TaxID=1737588 RepID=A0A5J6VMN3_9VIRU|nr:MAG: hypothetical protein [Megaviridae environmental sample]
MYINQVDKLFDNLLNNLYNFLLNKKLFEKLNDLNFVKYQNTILNIVKDFMKTIKENDINNILKQKSIINSIIEILKRYVCYYIFLGIAYHYSGDRDLFITNIMEISKSQKDSTFQIQNFFDSENNNRIIEYYEFIKHIIKFTEIKDIDKVKIILLNNPLIYEHTIDIFNELGEDYIVSFFLIKKNFHNIIKTIILKLIYLKEDKNYINELLKEKEIENAEYKYIDIIIDKEFKLVDYKHLQKLLTSNEIKKGQAVEYFNFLEETKDEELSIIKTMDIINYLFEEKILIPISEDYLRYHKDSEKYDKEKLSELENIKTRDSTKIKFIINQNNKIRNYYSKVYDTNKKLKETVDNYFYKPLKDRMAVVFNDNEEVNIINKLEMSQNTNDLDLLFDLKNLRKYSYVNFKNFSKDGFKLRPNKMIQSIRYTNLLKKKNIPLELRASHKNLDINIVGVAYNPKKLPLECFKQIDLLNINTNESKNGFNNIINSVKSNKTNKLYYWLFDISNDKLDLSVYKNISTENVVKYLKTLLEEFNNFYQTYLLKYYKSKIDKIEKNNFYNFNNLILFLKKKENLDVNINKYIYNNLVKYYYTNKIENEPILKIKEEKKTIKNKKSNKVAEVDNTIQTEEISKVVIEKKDNTICLHYIKWINTLKLQKNTDKFNQAVFNFVKQYVKTNQNNDYVCKSCNEGLNLKKYIYEGTYVKELDTFLTTNIATNQNLVNIPKYSKYTRSINNIEKNIEKISYTLNLNYYLGNTPIIKMRRRMIIKDIIDLILLHTKYLKNNSSKRVENAVNNYNIHKDLTNLFFFELKDSIFLTSSTDTDYYKKIKYNNVLAYTIFLFIIEINTGQIIQLKEDKLCNYFLYNKIGKTLFNNIYLRLNKKEKIPILSLQLLCYTIFYFSCMITTNFIWLWNFENKSDKFNTQKIIIHTLIDLINSFVEAATGDNPDYLYEIIYNRFLQKIKTIYNDKNIINRLKININKKFKFDSNTKKIKFVTKNVNSIILDGIFKKFINEYKFDKICNSLQYNLDKNEYSKSYHIINNVTNCFDGNFHDWYFKGDTLICSKCNKKYIDIVNTMKLDHSILKKIELEKLKSLTNTYCISGSLHDFSLDDNICKKCKKKKKFIYSNKELITLKTNLNNIKQQKITNNLLIDSKNYDNNQKILSLYVGSFQKIKNKYSSIENFNNYIFQFVNLLSRITGNKIMINNKELYLDETIYLIDHDFLGNIKKKKIKISSKDNKIKIHNNHPYFKKRVYYYKDNVNSKTLFYNSITNQYLGYTSDNVKFISLKLNAYLEIHKSLIDKIKYIGLNNQFINILSINKNFDENTDLKLMITEIMRTRANNLKQILVNTNSIIQKIKYRFSDKKTALVKYFLKKIEQINISDNNKTIFSKLNKIITQIRVLPIDKNLDNIKITDNYINTNKLINLDNIDNILIFYLLENFKKLLNFNPKMNVKVNVALLIINLINDNYNNYHIDISDLQIRKFSTLLIKEAPYIDENLRVVGNYQELVNVTEIDEDYNKDIEYNNNEEQNSLDIDDYDEDDLHDDFDPSDEYMDTFS